MLKLLLVSLALLVLQVWWSPAQAYPELIRHGYVNCLTCHVSPSGGGVLTDYGRTFSGEGLSTWSQKGEESLLHGLIPRQSIPTWLAVGGDARAAQVHYESPQVRDGRFIWMQADLEAAVRAGRFTFDASAGRFQRADEEPRLKSRRFFAMYNFTDELMVRAGRFIPVYGINSPEHIISTRQPLRFDQGLETENLEVSWITDTWSAVGTVLKGPVELPDADQEQALSAQIAYGFADTFKVGINGWSGRADKSERQLGGIFGLLGFSPDFYLLTEADFLANHNKTSQANTQGFFTYNRLGWEFTHGAHLLATAEYWQTNFDDGTSANDRYGIGTQLFPRPHFDFELMLTKFRQRQISNHFDDYAWLILHYYL